jgi:unsaturated chondroitin disaccharide hydrolase
MIAAFHDRSMRLLAAGLGGLALGALPSTAGNLPMLVAGAWALAEQRSELTANWLVANYGQPTVTPSYPTVGDFAPGHWSVATNTSDWRGGFWPGTLWLLAQRTGSATWRQRAIDWSAPLATSTNIDHDIGFITLNSLGKGWLYHDDLSDPGGAYRAFAKAAITTAATKLDSRFNKPNTGGTPVPAGFTRSWNSPFEDPYPVCIDNLMNLEVLFLAYELNGRQPAQRPWFDHALAHARNSIARHLRPNGSTYHVVKHFESGTHLGEIERKSTRQGYAHETTWSRGEAWAIYGFTAAYRHARLDPATNASDLLAAAEATAGYFLDHLPSNYTADSYNHRAGDFVPPSDFDAALGEPAGSWNDANNNYNSTTGTGLGDRKPALLSFTARDSSAAAIAASGLIDLSGHATSQANRTRYLSAAENIIECLITYDGQDSGTAPDYLCAAAETTNPGILKLGCVQWNDPNRSVVYGDFYFLEALARYEALLARKLLVETQHCTRTQTDAVFEFEITAPSLIFRVERSPDLTAGSWTTVAAKTGAGPWSGIDPATEELLPNGHIRVKITEPASAARKFFRILTRSVGGGGP